MTAFSTFSDAIASAVEASSSSVLRVRGRRRVPSSALAWSEEGIAVTAEHTLRIDDGIEVGLPDGRTVSARVAGRDPSTDIAVLRVDASLIPPRFSDRPLKPGHLVLALGRPGRSARATLGIISAAGGEWRADSGARIERYLECDASLPPGFSGGPLIDSDGAVIGINTSRLTRGGATIPIETLRRVVPSLLEHGHVPRPFLGVGLYPVRVDEQRAGLMILSVQSGSPAAAANLLLGDVLLAVDGQPLRHPGELHDKLAAGREIAFRVWRAGEEREVGVIAGSI